jgi:hypothetical protein
MTSTLLSRVFVAATLLLMATVALGPNTSVAQDASGTPVGLGTQPHPAHIHAGTCANIGAVVYPLTDLTGPGMMGTPAAGTASTDISTVIAQSTTTVKAPLDTILSEERAINVHESAEHMDVYIACGDLTGTPEVSTGIGHPETPGARTLQVALHEQNNSGVEGWAELMDNGNGTTTVDVRLMRSEGDLGAKQDATPSS